MNPRSSSALLAAAGCVLLASCYPYDESRDRGRPLAGPPQRSVSSPEQQKVQEQRERMKEKEAEKKKTQSTEKPPESRTSSTSGSNSGTAGGTGTTTTPKPPAEEKRGEFAFANKVPGKEGFVFSPYNNKIVDVREIPSGTLVQDPTYTGAGKGYFRVP